MKANELRIGNYVIGQTGELKNIPYGMPYKIESYEDLLWSDLLLPVPITEDWLVKFGFKIADEVNGGYLISINYDWQKEYLYCSKRGTIGLWNDEKKQDFIIMNKCEFIHQLQNLYFALTGKELKLKE